MGETWAGPMRALAIVYIGGRGMGTFSSLVGGQFPGSPFYPLRWLVMCL